MVQTVSKRLKIETNGAIKVMEDNTTCIHMAETGRVKNRSKHVDIKYHNVREAIKEKLIELEYCQTENNIADILTKPLSTQKHEKCVKELGMPLCTDVSMLSHSEDDAMSGNKKIPGAEDEVMCLLIGLEKPCICI